ncbi:MAG: alkaline phosphatase family protein [Gammaproteobacteria bacterium]|nr:alkaline phosphatase family protein [Gammaproteobacteria bacterium]
MINSRALAAVSANTSAETGAVLPLYDSYCFAGVPWSIEGLLGGDDRHRGLPEDCFPDGPDIEQVILMFVDGFGWAQFERFADTLPLLRRSIDEGVASKITSLFPSTTCAHVTCVHSGLTPSESGLYEWFQYEPHLDAMIAPLLFSYAGDHHRDGLLSTGESASMFFNMQTIHERLTRAGVDSICITPDAFTPSPFNDRACAGAMTYPYKSLSDGLQQLADAATSPLSRPRYLHYYYGNVDLSSHQFGPNSDETASVIERFFSSVENTLIPHLRHNDKTMLCVVADHGMANIQPSEAVYANERCPDLVGALQTGRRGPLVPAGSPRDLFLHIRSEELDVWTEKLKASLHDVATVHRTRDLIDQGLFGPRPVSEAFEARVGNLVILPFDDRTVWWHEPKRYSVRHFGEHGGLSAVEMEIPFLSMRF